MSVAALILAGGKATRMGGVAKHAIVIAPARAAGQDPAPAAGQDPDRARARGTRASPLPLPSMFATTSTSTESGPTIFEHQVAVLAPRVDEIIVSGVEIAGYRTVLDQLGSGPLAGIHAGLALAEAWLLVIAGDMPYITGGLIDALLAARSPELDAVAFEVDDRPEPLCSLLHARTRAAVERRLVAGLYKASGLFTDEGLRVRWLTHADPEALRNLNSPSDLPH